VEVVSTVKKAWFHASINASIINAIDGGNKRVSNRIRMYFKQSAGG
jgi:hypothetical protein